MKLPAPNRLVIYLTALASIIVALTPVATDLGLVQVATILGGLGGVVAVALKFLDGWQKYEAANYQHDLMNLSAELAGPPPLTQAAPPARPASRVKLPR